MSTHSDRIPLDDVLGNPFDYKVTFYSNDFFMLLLEATSLTDQYKHGARIYLVMLLTVYFEGPFRWQGRMAKGSMAACRILMGETRSAWIPGFENQPTSVVNEHYDRFQLLVFETAATPVRIVTTSVDIYRPEQMHSAVGPWPGALVAASIDL